MNFQQLEYLVALDRHKNFVKAAQACFVTQPTLSMMVRKLEEELGIVIFDRARQGVVPTAEGQELIARARRILAETEDLREYVRQTKNEVKGNIQLGIIPTLAPYLLPYFVKNLAGNHPELKIHLREMVTGAIVQALLDGELDMALLATPLHEPELEEHHLFYEEFFVYATSSQKLPRKKYILPGDIDPNQLWLLEEGHCMRNQIFNLCELKKNSSGSDNVHYEAGSIETLINLVDRYEGVTIVPHLATLNLHTSQKQKLREFAPPKPVREISLVARSSYPRKGILEQVRREILIGLSDLPFLRRSICRGPDPDHCTVCTLRCAERSGIQKLEFI